MADKEEKEAKPSKWSVDSLFGRVADYVGRKISVFVAFLFFLFAAGAAYGAWIVYRQLPWAELLIIVPAVLGLVAYYNRTFAAITFVAVIVLFVVI